MPGDADEMAVVADRDGRAGEQRALPQVRLDVARPARALGLLPPRKALVIAGHAVAQVVLAPEAVPVAAEDPLLVRPRRVPVPGVLVERVGQVVDVGARDARVLDEDLVLDGHHLRAAGADHLAAGVRLGLRDAHPRHDLTVEARRLGRVEVGDAARDARRAAPRTPCPPRSASSPPRRVRRPGSRRAAAWCGSSAAAGSAGSAGAPLARDGLSQTFVGLIPCSAARRPNLNQSVRRGSSALSGSRRRSARRWRAVQRTAPAGHR